jgi:hypothetical protein
MSKQRLDPDKIANELKGASSFFKPHLASESDRDASPPQAQAESPQAPQRPAPTSEAETRPVVRPLRPVRQARRQMIRHPFELYQDQVEALRQLAADERMRGGAGSMSAMVRQAIDRLIDEQSSSTDS